MSAGVACTRGARNLDCYRALSSLEPVAFPALLRTAAACNSLTAHSWLTSYYAY
jgi:hypothetical protein